MKFLRMTDLDLKGKRVFIRVDFNVPLEADGPDLGPLERLLARERPALFYLIPDFQNPSGATCSGEKRRRIAALAERHGFLLLEDAPYRMLRYRGTDEPTLRALAPARTLHMSSFTKLLAPGVRMGFVVGPSALIGKLAKAAEDHSDLALSAEVGDAPPVERSRVASVLEGFEGVGTKGKQVGQ